MDRRSQDRCPVCLGPATMDSSGSGDIRCRVSTCIHNHRDAECPRCKKRDLDSVTYSGGEYVLTCRECLNIWKKPG